MSHGSFSSGTFGSSSEVRFCPAIGSTITIIPGLLCTTKIEFSTTDDAYSDPDNATWVLHSIGVVSTPHQIVVEGFARAVRFSRTFGANNCSFEIIEN